ncbi:hypothetical protein [Anaerotignum sp.]
MFSNPYRNVLIKSLSNILKPETNIKSSTLLQAFATFKAIKEIDSGNFFSTYKTIFSEKPACYFLSRFSHENCKLNSDTFTETIDLFACLSPSEFFRFIISDIVSNPIKATTILHDKFSDNILLFAHHIIQVNRVTYSAKESGSESHEDVLDRLYYTYTNVESFAEIRLTKSDFLELYGALYLHPLDPDELKIRLMKSERKKLASAMDILANQLELPREEQVDIMCRFYVENEQPHELIKHCSTYNFTKNKDINERKKLLHKALLNLAVVSPLDTLCAISVHKKSGANHLSETPFIPNDITLENGLIYTLFTSHSLFNPLEEKEVLIFFPTPFFIRKWLSDPVAKQQKTTFIMNNPRIKDLIVYHYTKGTYTASPGKNITFLDYEQWQKRMETIQLSNANILLFASGMSLHSQSQWFNFLKQSSYTSVDVCALISSYEFEQALSPFSAELDDPHVHISTVVTIPQGINNSTSPRRKIFLRCSFNNEPLYTSNTKIQAFTLNTDLKTQALSKMLDAPVEVKQHDLVGLYDSVRKLYQKELMERKATGRKKVSAFPYEFTPDITIWCSKTYPQNNKSRPRLEAYICTPAAPKRAETGFLDRGKTIPKTKKHTTKVSEDNILNWLEYEYPFSVMQARYSTKELSNINADTYDLKPSLSIREEIIEHYGPYLSGKNIALKTLWYLHPDMEHLYSAKDYKIFEEIACSEIGFVDVEDITPEFCEFLFPIYFPEDSREDLLHKLTILSVALDKAISSAYCEKNLLRPIVQDIRVRNKLFAQVRNALTKKHFTQTELLRAYEVIEDKFNEGQLEYLGVMIRLLTGLESNIVCALKWKDIIKVPEYSFNKIVVTRQVTNDGKDVKGFDSLEDYLCFPCSLLLQQFLDAQFSVVKQTLPDWVNFGDLPVVTTQETLRNNKGRYSAFSPFNLERMSREVISLVGIPDHIIEIPDKEKGTKETNLNHYGGDFFRENFRYWALNKAKLTIDEVLYLIGNKPETTFGIFYCDYLNDASQLLMFVKLLRLDTLFAHRKGFCASSGEFHTQSHFQHKFLSSLPEPLQLRIRLILPQECNHASIEATCQYGLSTYVSPLSIHNITEDES